MKKQITIIVLVLFTSCCLQAQDSSKTKPADSSKASMPAAVAPHGPLKYYLAFTDQELGMLWDMLDNSISPHAQIKEMQKFIRNQIALQQAPPQQKPKDSTVSKPPAVKTKKGKL